MVDTRVINTSVATDAAFRDAIAGMRAQFAMAGLVQTADTGQIDPATAVRPGAANTAVGYEIWRFNDALQATLPIFIKVEYGAAPGASIANVGWWLTVGTGTNGAGTLTGQVSTRRSVNPVSGTASASSWYASGTQGADGGRFCQMANYNPGNANYAIYTGIERTRDGSGNPTADGIIFFSMSNNSSGSSGTFFQHIPATGVIPAGHAGTGSLHLPTIGGGPNNPGGKSIVGVNVALTPFMIALGKFLFGSTLFFSPTDIGDLAVITVNEFGADHTFICFGNGANMANVFISTNNFGIAMRWE